MADLIVFLVLLALGYTSGTIVERRHYRSIEQREADFLQLPAVTIKDVAYAPEQIAEIRFVSGNAVISIDYFKRLLASLRNIFGGNVKSYESLIDRARREAVLRMKAQARGAHVIVNTRIETSAIGKQANKKKGGLGSIEALAYGTAITLKPSP